MLDELVDNESSGDIDPCLTIQQLNDRSLDGKPKVLSCPQKSVSAFSY